MKRTILALSATALIAAFSGCAVVPHGGPVYGHVSVGVPSPYPPVVVVRPAPVIIGGAYGGAYGGYYGGGYGSYIRPAPRYYGHGGHWGHR
jgi:hypothetical protein